MIQTLIFKWSSFKLKERNLGEAFCSCSSSSKTAVVVWWWLFCTEKSCFDGFPSSLLISEILRMQYEKYEYEIILFSLSLYHFKMANFLFVSNNGRKIVFSWTKRRKTIIIIPSPFSTLNVLNFLCYFICNVLAGVCLFCISVCDLRALCSKSQIAKTK